MKFRLIGIGEVLWDMLPGGPQLGGAPANFAYHAHVLEAESGMITRVGDDEAGQKILRRFREMSLSVEGVQVDPSAVTGTASVHVSRDGRSHFTIRENVAWDALAVTPESIAAVQRADAICFGTLAQRSDTSRETIQQLIGAAPTSALRVFDINLRQKYYSREIIERSLRQSNVLKLNEDEVQVLAEMFGLRGPIPQQVEQLAASFKLQVVALTRGPSGSLLYQQGLWSKCTLPAMEVVDTVGAGDSFTAAMVLGLLCKMDLDEINGVANDVARYVCSQPGATPPMPKELAQRFHVELR